MDLRPYRQKRSFNVVEEKKDNRIVNLVMLPQGSFISDEKSRAVSCNKNGN